MALDNKSTKGSLKYVLQIIFYSCLQICKEVFQKIDARKWDEYMYASDIYEYGTRILNSAWSSVGRYKGQPP